jgi:hypothetical protein
MKQDDLRGKIMNEVKSQIRGIVNEEVAKINTKQRLKNKIKPLVAEELKHMVNEGRDYAKLQEIIWVDGSSGRGDEEMMDTLNQMYDNRDYDGMINYLSQWDDGDNSGREIYDDIQKYDKVLKETPTYILVTVDPRNYWGDRPYGLYIKLSADDVEQMGI